MLFTITFAFATGSGEAQTLNPFEIVLIGFTFVFCILLILSLATLISGKIFARIPVGESSGTADAGSATSPSTSKMEDDFDIDESDPHHIAVIAAAIHCAMDGRKHRIVSIRSSDSSWAAEGRRQIFSSRKVR